jgi:hypothetical protein
VPALTAFLIKHLQANQPWWMPNISGTPNILTDSIDAMHFPHYSPIPGCGSLM